jgi:hypothetical protein
MTRVNIKNLPLMEFSPILCSATFRRGRCFLQNSIFHLACKQWKLCVSIMAWLINSRFFLKSNHSQHETTRNMHTGSAAAPLTYLATFPARHARWFVFERVQEVHYASAIANEQNALALYRKWTWGRSIDKIPCNYLSFRLIFLLLCNSVSITYLLSIRHFA